MSKVISYRKPSSFEQYAEEFRQAIAGKRELTSLLRKKNFDNLDSKDTVTVYTGIASFRSPYEIEEKDIHQYGSIYHHPAHQRYRRKSVCLHQYLDHGTGQTAPSAGDCRRRLYRTGIRLHVCRFRFGSDRAGRGRQVHCPRRPRYCRCGKNGTRKERNHHPSERFGTVD